MQPFSVMILDRELFCPPIVKINYNLENGLSPWPNLNYFGLDYQTAPSSAQSTYWPQSPPQGKMLAAPTGSPHGCYESWWSSPPSSQGVNDWRFLHINDTQPTSAEYFPPSQSPPDVVQQDPFGNQSGLWSVSVLPFYQQEGAPPIASGVPAYSNTFFNYSTGRLETVFIQQPSADTPMTGEYEDLSPESSSTTTTTTTTSVSMRVTTSERSQVIDKKERGKKFCQFCKNNKETAAFYRSHCLKTAEGKVCCPVLSKYTCPICNATGEEAHTLYYCPKSNPEKQFESFSNFIKTPRRNSLGFQVGRQVRRRRRKGH